MQIRHTKPVVAAFCLCLLGSAAFSQSILNQSKDDLLKDFASTSGGTTAGATPAGGTITGSATPGAPLDPANPSVAYPNYQFPAQSKSVVQRLIEGAMSAVNVSNTNDKGTNIKVPFVNVNVGGRDGKLRVKAPFLDLDSANGVNVKAPFININRGFNGNSCYPPAVLSAPLSADPPLTSGGNNYSPAAPHAVPSTPTSGNIP